MSGRSPYEEYQEWLNNPPPPYSKAMVYDMTGPEKYAAFKSSVALRDKNRKNYLQQLERSKLAGQPAPPAKNSRREYPTDPNNPDVPGVDFNSTQTTDNPPPVTASTSVLLGIYGIAGMLLADKGTTPYMASAVTTAAGAGFYYMNYFST